jgi:hypothetical protein
MLRPEKAEVLRRQMENTERQVTADLKGKMEKEQQNRAQNGGEDAKLARARTDMAWVREVASRLQQQLASMTPAQLSSQARYLQARPWESVDSPEGAPLVMINPDFLDHTLPVDAMQIMIATFNYDRGVERGEPVFYGAAHASIASNMAVSRMKTESNWSALKEILQSSGPKTPAGARSRR